MTKENTQFGIPTQIRHGLESAEKKTLLTKMEICLEQKLFTMMKTGLILTARKFGNTMLKLQRNLFPVALMKFSLTT